MTDATLFTLDPVWGVIDDHTRGILELLAVDPHHDEDRARIIAAIVKVGLANPGRIVDPNALRRELVSPLTGEYQVKSVLVGATVLALRRRGILAATGQYTETEGSPHGNNGKPQRVYRLARTA